MALSWLAETVAGLRTEKVVLHPEGATEKDLPRSSREKNGLRGEVHMTNDRFFRVAIVTLGMLTVALSLVP